MLAVGEADAAIGEECGEGTPILEHIVDGLGDRIVARELGAVALHPCLKFGDERCSQTCPRIAAFVHRDAVDAAFNLKDAVDTPHGFERHRRDIDGRFAPLGLAGDIGKFEEMTAGMRPAQGARHCTLRSRRLEQRIVTGIGVGLQNAAAVGEVPLRMFAAPVAGVIEQGCRGCAAAKRSVITDIGPDARRIDLPLCQDRHSGIVGVEPLGCKGTRTLRASASRAKNDPLRVMAITLLNDKIPYSSFHGTEIGLVR